LVGRVFWLVLPYLKAALMQRFLDEFALTHATQGKRLVLVTDGATAHRATTLRVPERITLVRLPPYTPELNPTERLWRWFVKALLIATSTRWTSWSKVSAHVAKKSVPRRSR
jgi:hypothetical protein